MKKALLFLAILIGSISIKAQQTTTKEINHSKYGKAIVETSFDENNILIRKATYTKDTLYTKGDLELGDIVLYYSNGKISAKGGFSTSSKTSIFNETASRKKQGEWLKYTERGDLELKLFYKDDLLNGECFEYDSNGNISKVITYVTGGKKDISKSYFTNKSLHNVLQYKNGKLFNVLEFYNRAGTKTVHGTLKDGDGTLDLYNLETGEVSKTYTYEKGIPQNVETKIIASAKGDLIEKTYKNYSGKPIKIVRLLNGALENFDYQGNLTNANYYSEGKKHGTHTKYNDDGSIFWQDTYVNNKKIGHFKHTAENSEAEGNRCSEKEKFIIFEGFYDENEKMTGLFAGYLGKNRVIVTSGNYENNTKVGVWKRFNSEGILTKETDYFDVNSDKQSIKEYYIVNTTSVLKSSVSYVKGKKDGKWQFYDEKGNLTKEIIYLNGRLAE